MKTMPSLKHTKKSNMFTSAPTQPKLLAIAIAQVLALQTAQAATVEVTSNLDDGTDCTLREAVISVNNFSAQPGCVNSGAAFGTDDEIIFAPAVLGSTITLTNGQIAISNSVSINPASDTTISGNNTSGIFSSYIYFQPYMTIDLNNLILTEANVASYGAAIDVYQAYYGYSNGVLNLNNCTITGNTTGGRGAGIYSQDWIVNITDTTITNNTAADYGGGIWFADTDAYIHSITLTSSTLSNNSATFGGGMLVESADEIAMFGSMVTGNSASNNGGGIYFNSVASVYLSDSTVSGNSSEFGAGIFASTSTVSISSSTLSANSASYNGGGIFAYSSSDVSLIDSSLADNLSQFGGGLGASTSTVSVADSIISGNSVAENGGGILAFSSSNIELNNNSVTNNSANFGGGIAVFSSSTGLINNTTISSNSAVNGGGIFSDSADKTELINSTVSGNTAATFGGGIFAYSSATVSLINSTLADNDAAVGGGVYLFENPLGNPTLTMTNSLIANSSGSDDCVLGGSAVAMADVSNIIATDSCNTSAMNIDPGLLPLADNGGSAQTHALMPGSPAIDGGNNASCQATDQRGEARDDGACDIGAYEFKSMATIPISRKDRHTWALAGTDAEQWYSFDSTESQKLSVQTNGFEGDTLLELYTGDVIATAVLLKADDNFGPEMFSNIKHTVSSGPHLIRVKGNTAVNPYFLRLMSDKDILSFNDTTSHFANKEIRVMSSAGITGGCGVNQYCPTDPVTRAQMAIFMLKAILGGNHSSPAASGTVFSDVGTSSFGSNFIEEFSTLGITSGCGGGKYCPDLVVTREQMAVFLLRAWYGSSYTPPAATPAEIAQFSDIANSFARDWIVQLTKENITGGCGGGKFCPTDTVTRGQMAAFIARTFSLDTEL